MRISSYAANGIAEMKLGRQTRKGKCWDSKVDTLVSDYVFVYRSSGLTLLWTAEG
jgi:hypothetical protein